MRGIIFVTLLTVAGAGDVRAQDAAAGAQTTSAALQTFIGGVFYDLNQKATVALDFQTVSRQNGSTALESKVVFLHFNIGF